MTGDEILDDLRERLLKAADGLERMSADYAEFEVRKTARRLNDKAQGVRLALSYLDEYKRGQA